MDAESTRGETTGHVSRENGTKRKILLPFQTSPSCILNISQIFFFRRSWRLSQKFRNRPRGDGDDGGSGSLSLPKQRYLWSD